MSENHVYYLYLEYASALSICVPLIVVFIFKKYLKSHFTVLFYLIFADLLSEITSYYFYKYNLNNLFIFRSYTIIQFTLLSIFYVKVLSPSKITGYIKGFIFVFFAVAVLDLYLHGIKTMDDLSLSTASILLILYSLFTFFQIMQNQAHLNILSEPLFWFNTAVLIYFSGGLFLFIFNTYVFKHSTKMHNELWGSVNSVLNIIFNLLLATGFWKTKHRQIS